MATAVGKLEAWIVENSGEKLWLVNRRLFVVLARKLHDRNK